MRAYRDDVPPGGPLAEQGAHRLKADEIPPPLMDHEGLIQRATEERSSQQERLASLRQADGPPSHRVEGVGVGGPGPGGQYDQGDGGTEAAGQRHGRDTRADDGRRIPG